MIVAQWPIALATLLFAAGIWLLLPRGMQTGTRRVGAGLAVAGLALLTLLVHCGLTFYQGSYQPHWGEHEPMLGSWGAMLCFWPWRP